jgi:hypothetical protein
MSKGYVAFILFYTFLLCCGETKYREKYFKKTVTYPQSFLEREFLQHEPL